MGAVAGQFVKLDAVPTRKVVRVVLEMPIEAADSVIKALGGYPDPANAKWVGLALMKGEPSENTLKGGKLAQRAGILCEELGFRRFLADRAGRQHVLSPEEAKQVIYSACGITSRAHLDHDDQAARCFHELDTEYSAWRLVA